MLCHICSILSMNLEALQTKSLHFTKCLVSPQVQTRLGYCPQFDALIEQMTVEETLFMFARLRGVQEHQISDVVRQLIKALLLSDHVDKLAGNLR